MDKRWTILIVLVFLVGALMIVLALDIDWCVREGGPLMRCLWYENSLFGRFIHP